MDSSYLAKRAFAVKASIRTRMLELASTMDRVIPLGRGDPDFDTPDAIVAGGVKALQGGAHHYTAPAGLPELRSAICAKLSSDNGLSYAPEQVIVTNGVQEAALIAILASVNPDDEVVLQAPRFNAFDHMVNLAGGTVVTVPTYEKDDFALKAERIEEVLTQRSKLLVVANPNNPTGALTERDDLAQIAELARQKNLLVLSDEIYEKILFDGKEHESLAGFDGLYDRTITVNGFSKAYAMTGWRVGYLAAPKWFMEPAVEIKHTISICTAPAMQLGALAALDAGLPGLESMVHAYDTRRKLILDKLDALGLTYGRPGGGLYIYANVSKTGLDAETFCFELLKQQQVMIFPGTLFSDDGNQHVRITLLSPEDTVREALERLGRFVESL